MNNAEFESLLLYKYDLEKECLDIERRYYFIFGDELSNLLKLKIEVAILKRKISYCQREWNRGNVPTLEELEDNCSINFEEYLEYNKLRDKVDDAKELFDSGVRISVEQAKNLQKTFRKLMKLIHPDIHPEWQNDPLSSDIYEKGLEAYKNNNVEELGRLYALAHIHFASDDIVIENIDEKRQKINEEIKDIIENKPYTYRFILESPEKIKELHEEHTKDEEEYSTLKAELEMRFATFLPKKGNQA